MPVNVRQNGSSLIRGKYVIVRVVDENESVVLPSGAVYQEDGRIIAVGPYAELKKRYTPEEELGSANQLVMPGLINAHHHVGLTPFQLGHLDEPLELWIASRLASRDADPTLDTLYRGIQMIEAGITTVVHNHSTGGVRRDVGRREEIDRVIAAYNQLGLRVNFSVMARDQNRFIYDDDEAFVRTLPPIIARRYAAYLGPAPADNEEYLALCRDLCTHYGAQSPTLRISLSPQGIHWCSDALLMDIRQLASAYGVRIHTHLQETIFQKLYGLRVYGRTPLAHLHKLEFLGPDVDFAHGVWLTESDIELLAMTDCFVVHNASSNLRLKSGIAPVNALSAAGVRLAIGCDEAGINDDSDMLQEMRLVQKLHRVPGLNSSAPTSHQVLQWATTNAAHVAGYGDQIGVLEVGRRADIIVLDLDGIEGPYLQPGTQIVDALLYRGRGSDVDTVIVNGQVLLRGRRLVHIEKQAVWKEIKDWYAQELQPHERERDEISRALWTYVHRFYNRWSYERGVPFYHYNETIECSDRRCIGRSTVRNKKWRSTSIP